MRRTVALVTLLAALGLASCDGASAPEARPSPRTSPSAQTPAEREPTVPKGVVVENRATGAARTLAAQALRDLKALGFWQPLTKRLYVVRVQSRLGRIAIPDDGHLADALLQAQVDEHRSGALCNILFFPTAVRDDLARWTNYYESGYMLDAPPTLRQFWVAILGHELAHCLPAVERRQGVEIPAMSGEPVAERWEAKVLARARERLPAPGA